MVDNATLRVDRASSGARIDAQPIDAIPAHWTVGTDQALGSAVRCRSDSAR